MKIEKISKASKEYNEDGYIISDNFAMVIDGATSLSKSNLVPSSGAYLMNQIKEVIPTLKGSIIERLNTVSKQVYNQLKKEGNLTINMLPSAGLAWVEFHDEYIDIFTIGDCEVCIVKKDNDIIRIMLDDLSRLDSKAIEEMTHISNTENISIKEAREHINDLLISNRLLMNKNNGYAIFTPDDNPNFKYLKRTFKTKDIKEIYLYTDGFADSFKTFKLYKNIEDLILSNHTLEDIVSSIEEQSVNDYLYNKYPRFKLLDDITVVKINLV